MKNTFCQTARDTGDTRDTTSHLDPPHVLNPQLFTALQRRYGHVRVANQGEPGRLTRTLDRSGAKPRWLAKAEGGEHYNVNCQHCGDTRGRLSFDYRWGTEDERAGRLLHLVHCFNEGCHRDPCYRDALEMNLLLADGFSRADRPIIPLQPAPTTPAVQRAIELPTGCVPVDQLPAGHPASEYLVRRGFGLEEISVLFGVCYCERNESVAPYFRGRLVIPIRGVPAAPGERPPLLGWQARSLHPSDRAPKYLTAKGFPRSRALYNADRVRSDGPVVICEGPTDAWRLRNDAVATLGKTISSEQQRLLTTRYRGRPLVIAFDSDAVEEAQRARDALLRLRRQLGDPAPVVALELPEGVSDVGDCGREQAWEAVHAALGWNRPGNVPPTSGDITEPTTPAASVTRATPAPVNDTVPATAIEGAKLQRWVVDGRHVHYVPATAGSVTAKIRARLGKAVIELVPPADGTRHAASRYGCVVMGEDGVVRCFDDLKQVGLKKFVDKQVISPSHTNADVIAAAGAIPVDLLTLVGLVTGTPAACLNDAAAALGIETPASIAWPAGLPARYHEAAQQVFAARTLWDQGRPMQRLEQLGMQRVFNGIEKPLAPITAAMQRAGVPVVRAELERLIASDQEPGVMSTARTLLAAVQEDGRVRTQLIQVGAKTGRYASREPNLLGFPHALRSCVVAPRGMRLIEADYKHCEPSVLAKLCGVPETLEQALGDGVFYEAILKAIQEAGDPNVDQRKLMKKLFGQLAYWVPDTEGRARTIQPSPEGDLLIRIMYEFREVKAWQMAVLKLARTRRYVESALSRRIVMPPAGGLNSSAGDYEIRNSINSVVQATAADLFKLALRRIHKVLPAGCRLLLPLHDGVLIEAPIEKVADATVLVRRAMETRVRDFPVGLLARVSSGKCWGRLAEVPRK